MGRFDGKVAIITGASGGLGRAISVLFAKEGARLTITGRKANALKITKDECLKAGAKEEDLLEILGDITEAKVQDELISKTVEKFGRLDTLVNNHGAMIAKSERDEAGNVRIELLEPTMDVNFKSKYVMALKAMPHLVKVQGQIVNVNPMFGETPDRNFPMLTIACAALDSVTKVLAYEHAKSHVRVNSVNIYVMNSGDYETLGITKEVAVQLMATMSQKGMPLGDLPQPSEVAHLVAFLADGNTSKNVTGQIIRPDGGALLKFAATDFNFFELSA